jgi:hypothetical protein
MHTNEHSRQVTFASSAWLGLFLIVALLALADVTPLYAAAPVVPNQSPRLPDANQVAGLGVPLGEPVILAGNAAGAHSVQTADIDNDGDLDVIAASRGDGAVRWLRNDGGDPPHFEERIVGGLPGAYSAIPADVNGDGWVDIVAAAVNQVQPSAAGASDAPLVVGGPAAPLVTGAVVWYENNRQDPPSFTQHIILDTLDYPVSVFAADLDNDGDVDAASASRNDNKVMWYENDGGYPEPGFTAHQLSADANGAVSVHGGDLDNDGDVDLVSASENDDQIAWYSNEGGAPAAFVKHVIRIAPIAPEGIDYAKAVFVADVNGDGAQDIVYGSENANEIGWYENNGQQPPGFIQHVVVTNLDHVKFVFAADMDLDGDLDLFSASSEDDVIAWYENDGQQTPTFVQHVVTNGADGARSVVAADVDGDGDPDILAAARVSGQVIWFPNQTIHRSARYPAGPESVVATRPGSRHVTASDLDLDGDLDLISINDKNIGWHENDGQRPPGFTDHLISTSIDGGRWVHAADLDNDGDPDLLAASLKNNSIYWYENRGGTPPTFNEYFLTGDARRPRAVLAADLNNDGLMDIYSASDEDNSINWYANNGGQPPQFTRYLVTNQAEYARSAYAADVDGDGDLDLLSAGQIADEVAWYENNGAHWPSFQRRVIVSVHAPLDGFAPDGAQHVYAADLDGDGDLDVLSASEHDNTIAWYENNGSADPGFSTRFVTRNAPGVHAVTAADADQDGDMDVFAAIEYNNTIAWYENDGQQPPNFVYHPFYNRAIVAHAIDTADVDGDGDLDALAASRQDGKVLWFENLGGQYSLDVTADGSDELTPGRPANLMTVEAAHRGRAGDAEIALGSFTVEFHDQDGAPMERLEMNGMFDFLAVYRDANDDGRFDPAWDRLLAQVDDLLPDERGRVTLSLDVRNPDVRLAPRTTKRYFVVIQIAGACGSAYPPFDAALIITGGSARDANANLPLLPELARGIDQDGVDIGEPEPTQLFINEFIAANESGMEDPDEPGEHPDWVEIYNPGAAPADLGGMYLSDDPDKPTQYRIPEGVQVPAHGYLVFIVDGEFTQGPLHTNFRLSKDGESIGLFDDDAAANQAIDVHAFGEQEVDVSEGRFRDGEDNWIPMGAPTPGRRNVDRIYDYQYYLPVISYEIGC